MVQREGCQIDMASAGNGAAGFARPLAAGSYTLCCNQAPQLTAGALQHAERAAMHVWPLGKSPNFIKALSNRCKVDENPLCCNATNLLHCFVK
jgi:hypothetical protein